MLLALPMPLLAHAQSPTREVRVTFEATYEACRGDVYRWALRFCGGRAGWAEDLTHDVFVRLLETLPRLDSSQDLGGWLYRVTANLALSRLRRDRSLASRVGRFLTASDEEQQMSPHEGIELKEDAAAALAALRALPPKESVVLTMKVVDGKSQREIALALGMSEGYVSKLVTRSWEKIRQAGFEVSDAQA
ncbi:MAG: RNA polymerase sigma factor [Myxococcaceae bacterium]